MLTYLQKIEINVLEESKSHDMSLLLLKVMDEIIVASCKWDWDWSGLEVFFAQNPLKWYNQKLICHGV